MNDECGNQAEQNVEHPTLPGKIVNCRNLWFREFWQQHHRCTFGPKKDGKPQCTGKEQLRNYEQEGLVPFVGKKKKKNLFYLLRSKILFIN